ncbi:hypothetical protein MTR67_007233 [Solanum verrucosum]|uniref:Gag-pol polyprotein n=1 Tax=Solanum verrucosum TaxID=315347 RepID=A0AAF0PZW1_SOLVR|nr:hypothetical protein MTR67_007233 [Solanum verrucosum]
MQILRSCRCNLRSPSTDRRSDHGPCWWTVVRHCNPSPASSENWLSLDSRTDPRSVDQTTVRGLCPWIKTSFTQPLTGTTVDQHRPSFDPRSVGLTVDRRFRFSASRSCLDRFPISSSAESVARNANARNANVFALVPYQKVSNAEFRNANSAFGSGSQVGEDPDNFIDEVKKIFRVMQVTSNGRVEFASYQLEDVAHVWFT